MKKDIIYEEIVQFIFDSRGKYRKKIKSESELEIDLKITGDDAFEFIENFSKKFKVDISRFPIEKYFASESSIDIYLLLFLKRKSKRKLIKIKDLVNAVEIGELNIL
jgi:hypothetical protein